MTPDPDPRCVMTRSAVPGITPSPGLYEVVKISTTEAPTSRAVPSMAALRSGVEGTVRGGVWAQTDETLASSTATAVPANLRIVPDMFPALRSSCGVELRDAQGSDAYLPQWTRRTPWKKTETPDQKRRPPPNRNIVASPKFACPSTAALANQRPQSYSAAAAPARTYTPSSLWPDLYDTSIVSRSARTQWCRATRCVTCCPVSSRLSQIVKIV